MAHAAKSRVATGTPRTRKSQAQAELEVERRRAAAERMRGLFADVAPGRSLVDELIADRRAEAAAEDREDEEARHRRAGR